MSIAKFVTHSATLGLFGLFTFGCGGPVVESHAIDVDVVVDGTPVRSRVAFGDYDVEAMNPEGDRTCGWDSGNCGSTYPLPGTPSGDPRVVSASMEVFSHFENEVFYHFLVRTGPNERWYCLSSSTRLGDPVVCKYKPDSGWSAGPYPALQSGTKSVSLVIWPPTSADQ